MSGKISLIVGSHEHINPFAGIDEFEDLYKYRLKPFITTLNRFPKVQAILHYSGPLLSRLEQKKPESFMLIKDLVTRKQVEIVGGGFYEAPLPLLPLTDRIGQIEMFTTYLRQKFGRKPQGCMLANSAWEQSLVGVLCSCGLPYTFLSEEQCRTAGIGGDALYGPVFTEDQGKLVAIFPVFSFGGEEELADWACRGLTRGNILSLLRSRVPQDRERSIVTIFPRFPREDTEASIGRFFEELIRGNNEKNKEPPAVQPAVSQPPDVPPPAKVLELITPGRIYKTLGILPRTYFPASADLELSSILGKKGEYTPAKRFLIEHPESNDLYSKICFIHAQISHLRGDKSRKRAAQEELWKAQGALCQIRERGGTARKYAFRSLITAERIAREKDFKPSLSAFDFDLNGNLEYLFQDKIINCYIKTEGASLFELDYIPKGWNYLDTSAGGTGVYRRCAFMDRILPADFSVKEPADFEVPQDASTDVSLGGRFCGREEYLISEADRKKSKAVFKLPVKKNLSFGSIEIEKVYQMEKNILTLSYTLTNRGDKQLDFCFCPQTDLSFAGEGEKFYSVFSAAERIPPAGGPGVPPGTASAPDVSLSGIELQDVKNGTLIVLASAQPFRFFYFPVFRESYQSTCFLLLFSLSLKAGEEWKNEFTLSISAAKTPRSSSPKRPAQPASPAST
jgi:hypothetical protein